MTKKECDKIESETYIGQVKLLRQNYINLKVKIAKVLFNMKIVKILFRLK